MKARDVVWWCDMVCYGAGGVGGEVSCCHVGCGVGGVESGGWGWTELQNPAPDGRSRIPSADPYGRSLRRILTADPYGGSLWPIPTADPYSSEPAPGRHPPALSSPPLLECSAAARSTPRPLPLHPQRLSRRPALLQHWLAAMPPRPLSLPTQSCTGRVRNQSQRRDQRRCAKGEVKVEVAAAAAVAEAVGFDAALTRSARDEH